MTNDFNDYALFVANLKKRLPEIKDYYQRKGLRAEPERYPKKLFRAQRGQTPFKIEAYITEIDNELKRLSEANVSTLEAKFCLEKVNQQIQVLINGAKSSKKGAKKLGVVDLLRQEMGNGQTSGLKALEKQSLTSMGQKHQEEVRLFDKQLKRLLGLLETQQKQLAKANSSQQKSQIQSMIEGITSAISEIKEEKQKVLAKLDVI